MASTIFTDYDIQTHATPSIDPPPQAPALVQIHMVRELKLQIRTPQGNIETNYPTFTTPGFLDSFTVPHHVVASFTLFDPYVLDRLSHVKIDPILCNSLKQHIANCTCDAALRNLNTNGIQITVQLKVTNTVELPSAQPMYDETVPLLGEEVVIMEDGGGSIQRNGASKAAIDGLKTELLFFNEDEQKGTCVVCSKDFGEGTEVAYMPCSHVFHHKCIVPWLEANNSCPMCRRVVPDQ